MLAADCSVPSVHVIVTVPGPGVMVRVRTGRCTITRKLQVLVLPQSSVAVTWTVFVPHGNAVPDGGEETTVTLVLQLSLVITDQTMIGFVTQVVTTMFDGQVIIGGVVSTRVTVWLQVAVLLQQSNAIQVRVT